MKTANIAVTLLDHMGNDLSIVNAARVSFHKESDWEQDYIEVLQEDEFGRGLYNEPPKQKLLGPKYLSKADTKLINFLAKHAHKSPFNHAFLSFRVKAPIFVARQLVKHKFLPWNEVSRRYVDDEPEFYIPDYWRKKAENVKQGSSEEPVPFSYTYLKWVAENGEKAVGDYLEMLNYGVCPEQARMILPQNTMTEWVWSGSLGAFADMCKLRLSSSTQKETREVAALISKEVEKLFPVSWKALLEN